MSELYSPTPVSEAEKTAAAVLSEAEKLSQIETPTTEKDVYRKNVARAVLALVAASSFFLVPETTNPTESVPLNDKAIEYTAATVNSVDSILSNPNAFNQSKTSIMETQPGVSILSAMNAAPEVSAAPVVALRPVEQLIINTATQTGESNTGSVELINNPAFNYEVTFNASSEDAGRIGRAVEENALLFKGVELNLHDYIDTMSAKIESVKASSPGKNMLVAQLNNSGVSVASAPDTAIVGIVDLSK